MVRSNSNTGGPDECRSAQEVWQGSIEFDPHWCVSRPGLCAKVLVGGTVLQQVIYYRWRCAAGPHCRVTNMELGEHVMSESAVACPQSHNDHLVFSRMFVCWLVDCLTSQQHASVSQGRICSDNFTCCHTEIEVADPTFYLTQSQYTDTGPTSPSADPITPGAWQGSHCSANF